LRRLSNEEKRKKAEETRKHIAEVEANHAGIVRTREELFEKALSRPEYSEETKASLRRGHEANMEELRKSHAAYVQKLRGSL
jgi:aspartate oxidase